MITTILLLAAATIPIRNPFWPVNHRGVRESITDQPRIELKTQPENETAEDFKAAVNAETIADAKAAAAAAEDAAGDERLWIAARKALVISGSIMRGGRRQSITINGRIYADGDTVRAVHDGCEYFWRVKSVSETGMITLKRLVFRALPEEKPIEKGNEP